MTQLAEEAGHRGWQENNIVFQSVVVTLLCIHKFCTVLSGSDGFDTTMDSQKYMSATGYEGKKDDLPTTALQSCPVLPTSCLV